jgi:hypothetical protein
MATARDIIRKALQKNGVLVKGEQPSADEADDALDALNAMIGSWSNDSAIIYARTWESFPLVPAQSLYTIGTAANFNTERPLQIVSAYVRDGISDFDLDVVDDEGYNSFTFKSANGLPQYLNYDNAFPVAKIRLFPVPMIAYTLFILTEKQISSFATLDTALSLPPGWERALVYNLAVELAPEYSARVDDLTRDIARASLGMIKSAAIRARGMDTPRPMNIGNIYNGYWA